MGAKRIVSFPHRTVPETTEQFAQIELTDKSTHKKGLNIGDEIWASDSSYGGGRFRYVFAKLTLKQGQPVHYSAVGKVSNVATEAGSKMRAGFACAAISASQYGFIQVGGLNFFKIQTDKGIAAGDVCIKDQASKFIDTATNTGTQSGWVIGRALAADSASFQAPGKFMIECM